MNMSFSAAPNKMTRFRSWGLRLLAVAAFLAAGGAKLAGGRMMVESFDHIGIGQWFRVATGLIEVVGAIGLLFTATAAFSGLLLAVTMFVAVLVHVFVIGGNPIPAVVLLAITGSIAWLHRPRG